MYRTCACACTRTCASTCVHVHVHVHVPRGVQEVTWTSYEPPANLKKAGDQGYRSVSLTGGFNLVRRLGSRRVSRQVSMVHPIGPILALLRGGDSALGRWRAGSRLEPPFTPAFVFGFGSFGSVGRCACRSVDRPFAFSSFAYCFPVFIFLNYWIFETSNFDFFHFGNLGVFYFWLCECLKHGFFESLKLWIFELMIFEVLNVWNIEICECLKLGTFDFSTRSLKISLGMFWISGLLNYAAQQIPRMTRICAHRWTTMHHKLHVPSFRYHARLLYRLPVRMLLT